MKHTNPQSQDIWSIPGRIKDKEAMKSYLLSGDAKGRNPQMIKCSVGNEDIGLVFPVSWKWVIAISVTCTYWGSPSRVSVIARSDSVGLWDKPEAQKREMRANQRQGRSRVLQAQDRLSKMEKGARKCGKHLAYCKWRIIIWKCTSDKMYKHNSQKCTESSYTVKEE